MRQIPRIATTGLGLVTVLTLGVAGCAAPADQNGTGATPAPSGSATSAPAADPAAAEALTTAAQRLNDDSLRVTVEATGLNSRGQLDPQGDRGTMTMALDTGQGQAVQIEVVAVDKTVYLKVPGLPEVGDKWVRVDVARIAGTDLDILPEGDPAGADRMIKSMAEVRRDGPNNFAGTLDLSQAPAGSFGIQQALGANASALPFTATVDGSGRLTNLDVDLTPVEPTLGTLKMTYSDFGAPVEVTAPPADQTVDAPDSLMQFLGR
ncbi:hypothetical protein [Polymorphospora rubra]|uniref:Putative lipoprotein n=1 Tax=Polymorphospora rubra TaxID=338584 RepID=A0A810MZM6_9ACTN|nr:hypothetical protein [Polymorphospora rubra]BCJ66587.1 putative lipoprotein [Polymorphospora rubra]